jgi:3-deoxy-D-manno-octulosonate 8-phosphate phosphatase (KDO 8-P phosphatase)
MTTDVAELNRRCRPIEILILDVDGVLTDGSIIFDDHGVETKRFHVRDGAGVAFWRLLGKKTAIVTGRRSPVVEVRAADMKIDMVRQGEGNKLSAVQQLVASQGLRLEQACFMGDDLQDLPALRIVGLAATVADACEEVISAAHYVSRASGGRGAVRELVEVVLKAQGLWNGIVARYSS